MSFCLCFNTGSSLVLEIIDKYVMFFNVFDKNILSC